MPTRWALEAAARPPPTPACSGPARLHRAHRSRAHLGGRLRATRAAANRHCEPSQVSTQPNMAQTSAARCRVSKRARPDFIAALSCDGRLNAIVRPVELTDGF